ncbi:MAG: hypothetical protein JSW11_07185 [Candidatus Heimdallarchaeota archaeon]|nr:MAG: hypothetical protein JSW11_07185 [Candidatus Heimdallarchaeota archaeon]
MKNYDLSENIKELKVFLETGTINRKNHWKKYRTAVKFARKSQITSEEREILGKIDEIFFDGWNVPKFSIKVGSILLSIGIFILQAFYFFTFSLSLNFELGVILFILVSFMNFILSHTLIHWIFGSLLGINFLNYFIFKSTFHKSKILSWTPIVKFPTFGIKFDLNSFLAVSKWKRSLMFISAPIFSWIWFLLNFIPLVNAFSNQIFVLQLISLIIFTIFGISQLTGFFFYGDFWKARQDY